MAGSRVLLSTAALVWCCQAAGLAPVRPAGALAPDEAVDGFLPQECPIFIESSSFHLPSGAEFIAHLRAQKEAAQKVYERDLFQGVRAPAQPPAHAVNFLAAQQQQSNDTNVSAPAYPRDLYTKCQKPANLSYCTEVDWAVPFYGWVEWGQYQEQCLMYYIDYYYKDKKMSKECVTAMKNIGCASYFPKCSGKKDAEGRDTYLKPCRHMCETWKDDLACPGSEKMSCLQGNEQSISFSRYGDCTEYPPNKPNVSQSTPLVAPLPSPVAPAVTMVEPKPAAPAPEPKAEPKQEQQQQQAQQQEEKEDTSMLQKPAMAGGLSQEAQFELEKGDTTTADKMKAAEAATSNKKMKLANLAQSLISTDS